LTGGDLAPRQTGTVQESGAPAEERQLPIRLRVLVKRRRPLLIPPSVVVNDGEGASQPALESRYSRDRIALGVRRQRYECTEKDPVSREDPRGLVRRSGIGARAGGKGQRKRADRNPRP
jgi:hypothetical protein